MKFRRLLFLVLTWHLVQWSVESAPVPLETLQNQALNLPAASLTTNGIAGLTNVSPNLMVLAVVSNSLHGGTISLINTQVWVQRFNDSVYYNVYNLGAAIDHSGNVLVTGTVPNPYNGDDLVTLKYSSTGAAVWTNRFKGPINRSTFGGGIGTDTNDNVYITGNLPAFENGNHVVLVKYSSSGEAVWTNYYNSASTNYSEAGQLIVDPAGNSYLFVGTYGGGSSSLSMILKYDTSGAVQWTNVYGGTDYPNAFAVDRNGNLFVAGNTEINNQDMFTMKYSSGGMPLWTNLFDRDVVDQPANMTIDSSGNVIVTGDSLGTDGHVYVTIKYTNNGTPLWTNVMDGPNFQGGNVPEVVTDLHDNVFITGASPQAPFGLTNVDLTILKLTGAGVPIWTNRFAEANNDNPAPGGTTVDAAGNFYLTCHSTGTSGSNIDFVTLKYAPDGAVLWTNRYNGPGNKMDEPGAPIADNAGNVYVTGFSTGTNSAYDFAVVKYSDYLVYTPPTNFVGTDTITFTAVDQFGNFATNTVAIAVLSTSLQFNTGATNLQFGAQGLQLQVNGARGSAPVILFRSTDLLNWQPILTNIPALGLVQFLDTNVSGFSRAYYRVGQVQ